MKRFRFVAVCLVALLMVSWAARADAADIKVLCSNGIKAVMEELIPQFEKATQHHVTVKFGLAAVLRRDIEAGEPFDVAVLTPQTIDALIKAGKVAADSRIVLARSGLGLMIKSGATRQDIRTTDALKRVLLGAPSLSYAREGASGALFVEMMQKLGVTDAMKPKLKLADSGEQVGQWVGRGEVQFGVLPVSEILPIAGVDLLGTFPAEIQSYIVMVAGVGSAAVQGAPGRDFIKFVTSTAALPVMKKKGMERE
jgi:molybdate transport system substrate-binding protein